MPFEARPAPLLPAPPSPPPPQVQAFSGSGRPAQPPRLLHSADTCQLEVALVGASPRGNRSLFGLEVAALGQGPDCPLMRELHSIDDEYAPAVFQVRPPAEGEGGGRRDRIMEPVTI